MLSHALSCRTVTTSQAKPCHLQRQTLPPHALPVRHSGPLLTSSTIRTRSTLRDHSYPTVPHRSPHDSPVSLSPRPTRQHSPSPANRHVEPNHSHPLWPYRQPTPALSRPALSACQASSNPHDNSSLPNSVALRAAPNHATLSLSPRLFRHSDQPCPSIPIHLDLPTRYAPGHPTSLSRPNQTDHNDSPTHLLPIHLDTSCRTGPGDIPSPS